MNKKITGILLGVLVVFAIVFVFYKQGEPQGEAKGEPSINLAEAGGIVADNPDFAFDVSVYKEDVDDMRMATLSTEEKEKLALLIKDSEMTENTEGRPNGSLVYAEVSFTDNTGNLLAFGLYKSKESNDLFLNFSFTEHTKFLTIKKI